MFIRQPQDSTWLYRQTAIEVNWSSIFTLPYDESSVTAVERCLTKKSLPISLVSRRRFMGSKHLRSEEHWDFSKPRVNQTPNSFHINDCLAIFFHFLLGTYRRKSNTQRQKYQILG